MAFREARIRANKTIADVKKEMKVSDATVYNWETGTYKPRASLLPKIASFYGCTIDDLLREEPEE